MMLRDLKELEPGKFYVLEIGERVDQATLRQIRESWRENAPKDAKLMVLDGGMRITEATEEDLRRAGFIP